MRTRPGPGPLGEFLALRRSRTDPDALGVVVPGERRRVPGLRREELALLAGVSAPYYARLEQGTARGASPQVLDAIARALDLGDDERRHLHDLAAVPRAAAPVPEPERIAPTLVPLLAGLHDVPALVLGRRMDVLGWNPLGHALTAGHVDPALVDDPAARPNRARQIFTDPHAADLYADPAAKARAVVAHLRMTAGRYPDDRELAALVGELSMAAPAFARLWADHTVAPCAGGEQRLHHPLVGPLTVVQQTLRPAGDEDQTLVTFTAAPGSSSERALALLRGLTEDAQDRAGT